VLYELIAGRRAFEGASQASLIASILKERPRPLDELQPLTPKAIDRVVQTCLEKDPDKRWQSTREVKHALEWIALEAPKPPPPAGRRSNRQLRVWQGAAAVLAAAAVVAAVNVWPPWGAAPATELVRFQIPSPDNVTFETYVALSPDGRRIAFTAFGSDGLVRIWVRDLNAIEPRVLAGTENAQSLFWSPDSRYLGFGVGNQLKKIDASGGPPQTLCEVPNPVGSGDWSEDGVIVFGGRGVRPVSRVSETGGVGTAVPEAPGVFHAFPWFLPDNRHFVYFRSGPTTGIYVGSLDTTPEDQGSVPLLATSESRVVYASDGGAGTGHLLSLRDGTLMAWPFDADRLQLMGEPVPLAERVAAVNQYGVFSASRTGVLAYRTGGQAANRQLTRVDRQGKPLGPVSGRIESGGGSADMIAVIRLAWLVPSNAFFPVTISKTTAPKAKRSDRASASFPSSCSGDM
jgi:WD40 repeat protein